MPGKPISAFFSGFRVTAPTARLPCQVRTYKQINQPNEGAPIPSPSANLPEIPPYPYGLRLHYKQSNTGLYGRSRIRVGNNVSRQTEVINPQKTHRLFKPNVQMKKLWSESLGVSISMRVTTNLLRSVDKAGGLDEYLLGSKPARIAELGPWGWRLRWRVMQAPSVQERFQKQREILGLSTDEEIVSEKAVITPAKAMCIEKGS